MLKVTEASSEGVDYQAVLDGVRKVAMEAAARGEEIDKARSFPAELFDELEATGAFKVLTPKEYGGLGLTLHEAIELVYEGARGNGSLGWLMMIGTSQSVGNGLFPEATTKRMAEEFPFVRLRGVIAPRGVAIPVEGGYRVSGQWPFASGGPDPDFVSGNCVIMEDGQPRIGPTGEPELILAMVPAAQAERLDNWFVIGMRGTDSCDVVIRDAFVPEEHTANLHDLRTCYDSPAAYLPLRVTLSFPHCAIALGIAQGAIDDIVELAKTKRGSMNPLVCLGEDTVFRHELGKHLLRLEAVRGMLNQVAADRWKAGEEKRDLTPHEILVTRLMANFITDECVKVVDWAYTVVASSSVYDNSSLQRRFRDIHVATQHASCHTDAYRHLGAVTMGEELSPRQLF